MEDPLWSVEPLKQIFYIVCYLKLVKKIQIFRLECLFAVVLFLIENVVVHSSDLGMTVRKRSVALLPPKRALHPLVVVNEIGRVVLHIPDQVRERHDRLEPNKGMDMVGNAVDDDRFMTLVFDDPAHVFEHFIPPFVLKQVLASLHGKNNLDIDLGICACHVASMRFPNLILSSLRDFLPVWSRG
jgi:hypothetical protein